MFDIGYAGNRGIGFMPISGNVPSSARSSDVCQGGGSGREAREAGVGAGLSVENQFEHEHPSLIHRLAADSLVRFGGLGAGATILMEMLDIVLVQASS